MVLYVFVTHGHRRWDWLGRERMTCTVLSLILLRVNCAASRFLRAERWEDLGRSGKEWEGSGTRILVVYRKLISVRIDLMRQMQVSP